MLTDVDKGRTAGAEAIDEAGEIKCSAGNSIGRVKGVKSRIDKGSDGRRRKEDLKF